MKKFLRQICAEVLRLKDYKIKRLKVVKLMILSLLILPLTITGCAENSQAKEAETLNAIKIQVNGKILSATLEDNLSARLFAERLPLEVEMSELNGNEKYVYLDKNLPSESVHVDEIFAGDLMLFGSNCIVIFYKDFATSYSYTRLGKIENAADLDKILGNGNVRVKFDN